MTACLAGLGGATLSDNRCPPAGSVWARAADLLAAGRPVVLTCSNRSALVYPAAQITTRQMADLITRSSGFIQVALPDHVCDRLLLPEAAPSSRDPGRPAYGQCVAVDASDGITTGISAHDRARTARRLADPQTTFQGLTRPGHVVPVRAQFRPIHKIATAHFATAALSLVAMQSNTPGAVYADVVSPTNPHLDATPDDAEMIARELRTVAIRMG